MQDTKTKRRYLTKKMRMRRGIIKGTLIVFAAYFFISGVYQIGSTGYKAFHKFFFEWPEFAIAEVNVRQEPKIEIYEVVSETIREITAYNSGRPEQTDNSPCLTANGENVCTALARGYKRCAANFVPFGTRLLIENYGECLVTDRMNERFQNRVDIAMMADEKERAKKFGLQNLNVKILK
jgi:3D (Asp-Asp-Asp) domain-containing protein